jgi:hypothetical protein
MKRMISGPMTAAVVLAASLFATPCAAHHRHHHHYRHALLYVAPGLYYGCRPGWYCFGPPYRPGFARAWYGGFNSIYGYQGSRWRPQRRSTETTSTPAPTPSPAPPPAEGESTPPTGR